MFKLKKIEDGRSYDKEAANSGKPAFVTFIATYLYLTFFTVASPGFIAGTAFLLIGMILVPALLALPLFYLRYQFPRLAPVIIVANIGITIFLTSIVYIWLFPVKETVAQAPKTVSSPKKSDTYASSIDIKGFQAITQIQTNVSPQEFIDKRMEFERNAWTRVLKESPDGKEYVLSWVGDLLMPNFFDILIVEYQGDRVQYIQAAHTPNCEDRKLRFSMYDAKDDVLKILSDDIPLEENEYRFYCEYDWSKEHEAKRQALLAVYKNKEIAKEQE